MKRMKIYHNEDGLTLIEILASLVIISIVLISFSTILLQAMKHTKYNEEKLTEVDIAEEVIGKIRAADKSCGTIKTEVEDANYKDYYRVELTCEESVEEIPVSLGRATVAVTSKSELNTQKKSSFVTETYYKKDGER